MKEEIWKPIKGYEGKYEISSLGRVKSLGRFKTMFSKQVYIKERMLKINTSARYCTIVLTRDSIQKGYNVHSLVAIAFLGHKPNGHKVVVDHIDNNPKNNNKDNLRIVSQRKNTTRSSKKGKMLGVYKDTNGWKSTIHHNGRNIHLGVFDKKEKAIDAYKNASEEADKGKPIRVKKPKFSSNYVGVSWVDRSGKWLSLIAKDKVDYRLGLFDTEIEAHEAYESKRKELGIEKKKEYTDVVYYTE